MPFTLAHPAVILPFRKKKYKLSYTALFAGSIMPDFEFFFQMREVENIGHKWYGIFLLDIPATILFCYLFHNLLRNPVLANLPIRLRTKVETDYLLNWNEYACKNVYTVLLSALVGIGSHILLDGFTHYDGVFVEFIPGLRNIFYMPGHKFPVFYLLQIVLSLVGLAVVGYVLMIKRRTFSQEKLVYHPTKKYWPLFIIISTLILFVRVFVWPAYNSFWGLVMAGLGSVSYTWIIVSLLLIKRKFITQQEQ